MTQEKNYEPNHEIVSYVFTVGDLTDLTTYGGDEPRYFSNEAIDRLSKEIQDEINDIISEFLNHN